jgi:diguanylate cyclase (GGDEF)-like protein
MVESELAAVQLATRDPLTDVANRRGFTVLAEQNLRFCRRKRIPMSLVFVDIDDFKVVNDRFGHAEGDRALAGFAARMSEVARDLDVVGRLGGDEFVLLLVDANAVQAERVVERLRRSLDAFERASGSDYGLVFSHGVVTFDPDEDHTIDDMLTRSDEQMYRMKRARS